VVVEGGETKDPMRLVSKLISLRGPRFLNVKVLATSRKEPDIERLLQDEESISLSNPPVDEDTRVYIRETLASGARFQRWRPSLAKSVEDSLTKGAKGM